MSGPKLHAVAAGSILETAARIIAELEQKRLPDLSGLIVLLPNLHAASDLGRALRKAAGVSTLLLPRMTTLRSLAEECDPGHPLLPPSRRQALVYRALRDREWFRHADLWNVSAELVRLFDEITVCQVTLPSSRAGFVQQLEQAYQARAGSPLQFEARLVHELWHAMSKGDGELDDAARYQLQLAQLADNAAAPLYVVGLDDLSPLEHGFLELYSRACPVHWFRDQDTVAKIGSPERLLSAAWADPEQHGHLNARSEAFRATVPDSPLRQSLSLFGAHSLEQEAAAIAHRVGQWLAQGKNAILVVAQDRLVARRARALLERDKVLVSDETGWTLSTTSASTVVMRWLDNLDSRFHYQDLLDLLKSPFIFSAWEPARRRHGVFHLEQVIRKHNLVSHLKRYRALAGDEEEVRELLDTLDDARKFLDRKKTRSLAHWLQGLLDSLDMLQIRAGLAKDPAGEQLLQLLDQLGQELAPDATPFRYTEWRQWLNQQLEAAVFRDTSIVSPVVFTHLAATRLRRFDAAIVAGADAAHLPASGRNSVFFNQTVRAALGLSQRKDAIAVEGRDLTALLSACPMVWVTWQARKNGKPNALSPWFERLETFHLLTYQVSLQISLDDDHAPAQHIQAGPPAPALPPRLVPSTISASGYNSLVACPYQYHARHALRLNELDEVSLALEKADYGEYVHLILHRFHRTHPVLTGQDPTTLEQALRAISEKAFANAIAANFVSHAWRLRWEAAIPGYIRWQVEREQQGWRWREGELERTLTLELADGHTLVLRGRLDRVDSNGASLAVLDYKTESKSILKKKLQDVGEDVQLPCYALLLQNPPRQAAFIAVDGEEAHLVEAEENIADLAQANRERLEEVFTALYQGAKMPAQGTTQACEYCEMRGLCRKDFWQTT